MHILYDFQNNRAGMECLDTCLMAHTQNKCIYLNGFISFNVMALRFIWLKLFFLLIIRPEIWYLPCWLPVLIKFSFHLFMPIIKLEFLVICLLSSAVWIIFNSIVYLALSLFIFFLSNCFCLSLHRFFLQLLSIIFLSLHFHSLFALLRCQGNFL